MPSKFSNYPQFPHNILCANSYYILCNAHDASTSFLEYFNKTRSGRNARGTPTDEEQDLLRAMLVFASSGLDSLVKQLVHDVLPTIIDKDIGANEMFMTDVERRLKRGDDLNHRLIASVLCDQSPRKRLIEILVNELTSQSIQSTDQVLRVAAFFNIRSNLLTNDPRSLSQIFEARNQIVHEMDVDFSQPNRSRRPRARQTMIDFTNEIFRIANAFLVAVDSKTS